MIEPLDASDALLRAAMFEHLDRLLQSSPDGALVSAAINTFTFQGRPIRLIVQSGIWKPAGFHAALTIRTTFTAPNQPPPYADDVGDDGLVRYKYRGTDPNHADNRALRTAMVEGLPLAYFVGVPLRVSSVNKEFDVVIIGDCNPDIVLSGPDVTPEFDQHEKLVPNAAVTIGGSGSITACACARIGLRTRFVGAVGDDLFGQFMIGRLHDWGVDTTLCPVLKGEATGFSVILNNDVDRAILTYPGTIGRLGREHLPLEDLVTARHVHVTAYFLQHRLASQLPDLVGQLRAAGVTVSVDPNWDPDGDWDSGLRSLLGSIDILFPNAAEARAIVDEPDARVAALKLASDGTLRGCARINPAMSGPCSSTRRGTRGG